MADRVLTQDEARRALDDAGIKGKAKDGLLQWFGTGRTAVEFWYKVRTTAPKMNWRDVEHFETDQWGQFLTPEEAKRIASESKTGALNYLLTLVGGASATGVVGTGVALSRTRGEAGQAEKSYNQTKIDTAETKAAAETKPGDTTYTSGQLRTAMQTGNIDTLLAEAAKGSGGATVTDRDIELAVRSLGQDGLPWSDPTRMGAIFGPNPYDQHDLFWESGTVKPLTGYAPPGSDPRVSLARIQVNRRSGSKSYSLREARARPYALSDAELQNMAEKFWLGGYLNIPNYDLTKPFADQYQASAYDPAFQQAYQRWIDESFTDRTKSATAILQDRIAKRKPILDRLMAEALEGKVKDALSRVTITDPARLRSLAQSSAQAQLGRGLTVQERADVASWYSAQEQDQVLKAVRDEATVDLDANARIAEKVRADHPVEAEALDTAEAFSMFTRLLGPGGIGGAT